MSSLDIGGYKTCCNVSVLDFFFFFFLQKFSIGIQPRDLVMFRLWPLPCSESVHAATLCLLANGD